MDFLSSEDLDYFCEQSTSDTNMMIAGMTTLMSDNAGKVAFLENQTWFQRMCNTITGKNRMTVDEINMNMTRVNGYLTEAIGQLYERNKVDHEIMLSLGNRINEIYESQIDLKEMLGSFVNKLNQKIVSIDNFHMLIEEINQKVYNSDNSIVSVCMIASQLDTRTIHDTRKMDILKRAMYDANILTKNESPFIDFLSELLAIPESQAGVVTLALDSTSGNYSSEIARDVMLSYFGLPAKIRKMKQPRAVAENVLNENQIDLGYSVSTVEFFDSLVDELSNIIIHEEIEEKETETFDKYTKLFDCLGNSLSTILSLLIIVESWLRLSSSEIHECDGFPAMLASFAQNDELYQNGTDINKEVTDNITTTQRLFKRILNMHPELTPSVKSKFYRIDDDGVFYFGDEAFGTISDLISRSLNDLKAITNGARNYDKETLIRGWNDLGAFCVDEFHMFWKFYTGICHNLWDKVGKKMYNEETYPSYLMNTRDLPAQMGYSFFGEASSDCIETYMDLLSIPDMFSLTSIGKSLYLDYELIKKAPYIVFSYYNSKKNRYEWSESEIELRGLPKNEWITVEVRFCIGGTDYDDCTQYILHDNSNITAELECYSDKIGFTYNADTDIPPYEYLSDKLLMSRAEGLYNSSPYSIKLNFYNASDEYISDQEISMISERQGTIKGRIGKPLI